MGSMSYSDDERADQDRAALYARIKDLERDELIQAAKWYRERYRSMCAENSPSVALHEAALAEKDARIKELEEYIKVDAKCPRCSQVRECADGCRFIEDRPGAARRQMLLARKALYG